MPGLNKLNKQIRIHLNAVKENLTDIKDVKNKEYDNVFLKAKDNVQKLFDIIPSVYKNLFSPIGISMLKKGENSFFCDEIKELIKQLNSPSQNQKIIIQQLPSTYENEQQYAAIREENLEEAYIIWDYEIKEAVRDIFTNVRHSKDQAVRCPWPNNDATKTAHMWVQIEVEKKHLSIELKNPTVKSQQDINDFIANNLSVSRIKEVGGNIKSTVRDQLATSRISIPYAHCLPEVHGGNNG